jgi:protein involved in polysaccharide export with SLBB domain
MIQFEWDLVKARSTQRKHDVIFEDAKDDQVVIRRLSLDEIPERPSRIDVAGNINATLDGRLHVAGFALDRTEAAIRQHLQSVQHEPEVTALVAERSSLPVSVLSSVRIPGARREFDEAARRDSLLAETGPKETISCYAQYLSS